MAPLIKKQPACPGRRGGRRGCEPWAGSAPGGGDGSPRRGRRATRCSPSPAWRRRAPGSWPLEDAAPPQPHGRCRRAQLSQLAGSALLHPELCLLRFRAQLLPQASGGGVVSAQKPALLSGFLLTSAGPLPSSPHPLPFASRLPLSGRPPIRPQVPQGRGGTCSGDRITLSVVSALWAMVRGPLTNFNCGENTFFFL